MPDATPHIRQLLARLFAASVRAVDPAALVAQRLLRDGPRVVISDTSTSWSGLTLIAAVGKAAIPMAESAAATLGSDLASGVAIAPRAGLRPIAEINCLEGGHPLPSVDGERATRRLMTLLASHPNAAVLALISGGASSLMVQPTPPVTLDDKIATTAALLACGASIQEFNTVRKHLSQVKGGGLVRLAHGRPLVALILSDVIGDDPADIGSGPTAADPTTFADVYQIVQRYGLSASLPSTVLDRIEAGQRGELDETLKPGAAELGAVSNVVIGSNAGALRAAAAAAYAAGYEPIVADEPLSGDTTAAARTFAAWITRVPRLLPTCFLAGGETTVSLGPNPGRGGRNQEFALACSAQLAGSDIVLLSAGTDGVDGPTDAAGAFVDGSTSARARTRGCDPSDALAAHDSYRFFAALGDLFQPGPTSTNVMDIKIALVGSAPPIA
ncbi:MAG: DUF4147 domain-containing protein [Deltaproteobacteria bacterium]|nr:DUF4147 domain-containing protein [Deltaproteobacteria bacterium]MBI3388042.1 DUF4147 domain-containing protein [Deltaproteobacteria bacterium]